MADENSTQTAPRPRPHKLTFVVPTIGVVMLGYLVVAWWRMQHGVIFRLSFFMFLIAAGTCYIIIFSRSAIRPYIHGIPPLERIHQWAMEIINSPNGVHLENLHILTFTACIAWFTLGRTMLELCPKGTSIWAWHPSCPPLPPSFLPSPHRHPAVPPDYYFLTMFAPLLPQILFKVGSKGAILVSWILSVVTFNAAHALVRAPWGAYTRINLAFVLLMALSYEYERLQLVAFLRYRSERRRGQGHGHGQ